MNSASAGQQSAVDFLHSPQSVLGCRQMEQQWLKKKGKERNE
jgi:hypothetical protein